MATVTTRKVGTGVRGAPDRTPRIIENILSFAATSAASADVIEALSVPASTLVLAVGYDITTAETAGTFDIGDAGSATRFQNNADATATGNKLSSGTAYLYAVADTIDLTLDAAYDEMVIRVWAIVVDMSSQGGDSK